LQTALQTQGIGLSDNITRLHFSIRNLIK